MSDDVQSSAGIKAWSQKYVAEVLSVSQDKVDPAADFDRLGLDSTLLMSYLMTLEERLGIELAPDIFFSYTTIASLSDHLASRLAATQ